MQVYIGRTGVGEGRLPKEMRVYDLLDSLGVEYYRIDHSEADTMEKCEKIEKELNTVICKNLFLCNRQRTEYFLLMMPGNKVFKTKDFSPLMGSSRLSFASSEDLLEILDLTPGSVSIMGLMNDKAGRVRLAIDEDVLKPEFIGCHPSINTSSLKIRTSHLLEKYLPAVNHTPTIVTLPRYEEEKNKMAFESAKWIWIDNENAPDTYGEFCFTLKKGRGTYMNLSCDGDYTLFVNGEYVSSGQYGDYEHYKIYDTVSLDKYLTNEENRVCILVWHIGVASSRYRPYKTGVIFEVYDRSGTVLSSSESIMSRKSHAYKNGLCKQITSQLGIGYSYDFTKEDEWLTCAVGGFLPSHVVEKSAKLYPRPIKKHYLDALKTATQIGTSRVYDLGREYVGFLCFEIEAEKEGEINIAYGECLEGGRVKRKLGDRDFSVDYKLKKGKNTHTSYMLRFACRYLEIDTDVKIRVLKLGIIPQKYDVKRTSFKPSSELDAKIYDTCVNTLELCMMEHYVDCPWREQCLYAFDSRNQMLTGYYAFEGGNYDYARANLLLMSKDDRCDNLLSICFPCGIDLTIPSFSLYYVISLYEYLIHTGDKELVLTVNSKVKGLLDVFCANIEGSLQMNFEGAQYWNFFDWSDRLDGAIFSSEKKKVDIMLSLLTVIALKAYKEICKISEMEFSYQIVIDELSQSFKEKLYDEKSGLVLLNGKALELPNALLVLSGILTKDEEARICKSIMSGALGECSLSMKCFVYDALIKSGEGAKEYILSKIRENYERMIETGTVWETLKGTQEFDNAGSLCHGWSAVPVYYYNLFYNIDRNK